MTEIILSADGDSVIYAVPDVVAENLRAYCLEFCDHWLTESPDAKQYRQNGGLCYTEADFIEYLNRCLFPDETSVFIKNLGWIGSREDLPKEYADYPSFSF